MTKKRERTRRIIVALVVGAVYRMPDMSVKEIAKAAWSILRALVWRGKRVDRWTYYKRLRCCFACPIFFKPLRTCGSPLAPDHPELGCSCEMERKAGLPKAKCWARENTDLELGWPPCLNE